MTTRTATARLDGNGLRFIATTGSGHDIVMDDAWGDAGPRPAELLLAAQAGCAGADVISMLRKARQPITDYEVRVTGEQRHGGPPKAFEHISIVHVIRGDVTIESMRRAIELSATRYCAVTGNLASGVAEVRHGYLIRDTLGDEYAGQVVVTGPRRDFWDRYPLPVAPGPARARAVITVTPERSLVANLPGTPSDGDLLVLRRLREKPELLLELL